MAKVFRTIQSGVAGGDSNVACRCAACKAEAAKVTAAGSGETAASPDSIGAMQDRLRQPNAPSAQPAAPVDRVRDELSSRRSPIGQAVDRRSPGDRQPAPPPPDFNKAVRDHQEKNNAIR